MSSVLVGSAYGILELRSAQFDQGVDVSLAKLAQLRAAFSQGIPPLTLPPVGGSLPGSPNAPRQLQLGQAQDIQKDEQAMLRYAQSLATAQKAQGDLSGAASTYRTVLGQLTPNTIEANRATAQLLATEAALAKETQGGAGFAQQFGQGLKSGLLGIVGPLALAATAIGAVKGALDFTEESFKFKASLDQSTTAIGLQVRGVRDVAGTFEEARAFANRYKLTQEETNQAIQASVPILRSSNASLTDVESTLLRLQAKKPEKSIADAARALDELKAGQIISIVDQFNVSREAANKMKNEIAGGADAVQVLSRYLTGAGIGMNALEARTRGATGALHDQEVAYEKLRLAAGGAAGGPGLAITKAKTAITEDAADLLGGQRLTYQARNFAVFATQLGKSQAEADAFGLSLARTLGYTNDVADATQLAAGVFDEERSAIGKAQIAIEGYGDAEQRRIDRLNAVSAAMSGARASLTEFNTALSASADKSTLDAAQKDVQSLAVQKVALSTKNAADAFIRLNPNLDASQAFALAAAQGLDPLVAQVIALRIEADKTRDALLGAANLANQQATDKAVATGRFFNRESGRGGGSDAAADSAAFVGVLKTQNQEQQKLLDSEIALAGAKKQTAREIELLREKQSQYAKGTAEFNQIEAQIIGIQTSGGRKRVDAAQSTALQLQNVEENSQAALLKAQREGLERLSDQQQDFELKRARSQEDEDRKIASLYAHGQRAQAEREKEDFQRQQERDRQDYTIARVRTLRNNAESVGDISGSAERRSGQIGERAALRGVRTGAAVDLGANATPAIGGGTQASRPSATVIGPFTIAPTSVQIDGKQIVEITWPQFVVKVDDELSASLSQVGIPGSGQSAVGGVG